MKFNYLIYLAIVIFLSIIFSVIAGAGNGIVSSTISPNGIVSSTISPNVFSKWTYTSTGNESVLYDLKNLSENQICITPKNINLKPITNLESERSVTYTYPKEIKLYTGTEKTLTSTKDLTTQKEIDGSICFNLDSKVSSIYKIGEATITLSGETTYDSTNTNITNENKFAHLNISDPSLVLYMPFDVVQDAGGLTYDYTNNTNDGTTSGATFNSSGYLGGSYNFDGTNDQIYASSSDSLNSTCVNQEATISFYAKLNKEGTDDPLILKVNDSWKTWFTIKSYDVVDNNWTMIYMGNGTHAFLDYTQTDLLINEWYHYVVWYNGTHMRLYIDNVLKINRALNSDYAEKLACDTEELRIGAKEYVPGWFNYANVSMDEIRIYNKALSTTELAYLENSSYSTFNPTGEQLFQNNNFGTNNTVNISIANCQELNGSILQAKINDGEYADFVNCNITGYNISGNFTTANLTIKYNSTVNNRFYSPIVAGNITLDSYYENISTCTYPSGNWNVNCNDNCTISSNVDLSGNNITIAGTGTFTISGANITGATKKQIWGNSSTAQCVVKCVIMGCSS
jgi:hypothetical protein